LNKANLKKCIPYYDSAHLHQHILILDLLILDCTAILLYVLRPTWLIVTLIPSSVEKSEENQASF